MKVKPNKRLLDLKRRLTPFCGVVVFVAVVLVTHLSWKMFFHTGIENQEHEETVIKEKAWRWLGVGEINRENKDSRHISFLNKDVTTFFVPWAEKTAVASFWVVDVICMQHLFLTDYVVISNGEKMVSRTLLSYDKSNGSAINIIWGCTGVKQLYIFFFVILFSRGIWWKRFIYFLAGCLALLLFNVIRISSVVLFAELYPGSFDLLHNCVFKYLFYGLIFLLWVLWEEKFSRNNLVKE